MTQKNTTPKAFPMMLNLKHSHGIVTIVDANTTIAYCRYNETGEIEYIFVNSAHRRQGYAKQLLTEVESQVKCGLRFQSPLSPLGATLQRFYAAQTAGQ